MNIKSVAVRRAVLAMLATTIVLGTGTSAFAAKVRVCYLDPGKGMVCEVVTR